MSDKHEVLDLSSLRQQAPEPKKSAYELAEARLKGRSFSQLSPSEKDDLLMVVGVRLGILAPEEPEH
jgi:hypothetical protein